MARLMIYLLQGFSQLNLTPFEADKVLAQAAHRLGIKEIPDKYLQEGSLSEILIPEDYRPLQNVSAHSSQYLGGCGESISIPCCPSSCAEELAWSCWLGHPFT